MCGREKLPHFLDNHPVDFFDRLNVRFAPEMTFLAVMVPWTVTALKVDGDSYCHLAASHVAVANLSSRVGVDRVRWPSKKRPQRRDQIELRSLRLAMCYSGYMRDFSIHDELWQSQWDVIISSVKRVLTIVFVTQRTERVPSRISTFLTKERVPFVVKNVTRVEKARHPQYHGIYTCGKVVRSLEPEPFTHVIRCRYDLYFNPFPFADLPIFRQNSVDMTALVKYRSTVPGRDFAEIRCMPQDVFFVISMPRAEGNESNRSAAEFFLQPRIKKGGFVTSDVRDEFEADLFYPLIREGATMDVVWSTPPYCLWFIDRRDKCGAAFKSGTPGPVKKASKINRPIP